MAISKPTLGQLLEASSDIKMRDLPVLTNALKLSSTTPVKRDRTAGEHLRILSMYEPELLSMTLPDLIKSNAPEPVKQQKELGHSCKSVMMWVILGLISLGFSVNIIIVSLMTSTIPDWLDMLMPFIGPLAVVLHERGLLARADKDLLKTLVGEAPTVTFMEAVSKRILSGPQSRHNHQKVQVEVPAVVEAEVEEIKEIRPKKASKADY